MIYKLISFSIEAIIICLWISLMISAWRTAKLLRKDKDYHQGCCDTLQAFEGGLKETYEQGFTHGLKAGYEKGFMEAVKLNDHGNTNPTGL